MRERTLCATAEYPFAATGPVARRVRTHTWGM